MLISLENHCISSALQFTFKVSNNEAEYEALLAGLRIAKELQVDLLLIFSDSKLVVSQISREFQARDDRMAAYFEKVKAELQNFSRYEIVIALTNVTFTGSYFLFWRQICCISNLVVNILGTITFVLASLTDTWLCKNSSENNVIFVLFLNVKIWQEFNIDLKLILKFPLFQIERIGLFS